MRDRPGNPANIRGDIQNGLSGDKKPGFDPAAAPLETDSEAGGAPLQAEHVAMTRDSQYHPDMRDWQGTRATAMRHVDGQSHDAPRKRRSILLALMLLIGLVVIAGVVTFAA
jgi:hypothetical protein